jgi:hypothetical protein
VPGNGQIASKIFRSHLDNLNQNLGSPKNCLVVLSSLQSGLAHLACEVVLTAGDLGYMVQNLAFWGYHNPGTLLTDRHVDLTNKIVQKNVCVHNVHLSGSQGSTHRLSYPVYSQVAERGCYYCLIDVQWQIHVHVFHLIVGTRTSFNDL